MSNTIKFPFAIDKSSNEMVDSKGVPNGQSCNCKCHSCGEDVVAVNREVKQKAHFRHKPEANCTANLESLIHWASKEVFRTLKNIRLPAIQIDYESFIELHAVHEKLGISGQTGMLKSIKLQDEIEITIEKRTLEKIFKTKKGSIRADIEIQYRGRSLLIEPFYMNPIDKIKKDKLRELDISTISISLMDFVTVNRFLFSVEEFKNFLINEIENKEWAQVSSSKMKLMKDKFLMKHKEILNSSKFKQLPKLYSEKKKMETKIERLNRNLNDIQQANKLNNRAIQNIIGDIDLYAL